MRTKIGLRCFLAFASCLFSRRVTNIAFSPF
jgi:hypothetical protein